MRRAYLCMYVCMYLCIHMCTQAETRRRQCDTEGVPVHTHVAPAGPSGVARDRHDMAESVHAQTDPSYNPTPNPESKDTEP